MTTANQPEVWLRGSLPGILPSLQPVAHALLQASEELNVLMTGFSPALLWQRPAGVASPGFHLQHMRGVLDRLCTYAEGKQLTALQLQSLAAEGLAYTVTVETLVMQFDEAVSKTVSQLKTYTADQLFEIREVGRAKIPSTVVGLLVHAAEHTMRHLGQLLVTVKVLKAALE